MIKALCIGAAAFTCLLLHSGCAKHGAGIAANCLDGAYYHSGIYILSTSCSDDVTKLDTGELRFFIQEDYKAPAATYAAFTVFDDNGDSLHFYRMKTDGVVVTLPSGTYTVTAGELSHDARSIDEFRSFAFELDVTSRMDAEVTIILPMNGIR